MLTIAIFYSYLPLNKLRSKVLWCWTLEVGHWLTMLDTGSQCSLPFPHPASHSCHSFAVHYLLERNKNTVHFPSYKKCSPLPFIKKMQSTSLHTVVGCTNHCMKHNFFPFHASHSLAQKCCAFSYSKCHTSIVPYRHHHCITSIIKFCHSPRDASIVVWASFHNRNIFLFAMYG